MTKRKENPQKRGPKTKWKDEFIEQAGKLALLGFINVQLAEFFEVVPSTFDTWIKDKPELKGILKENRALANGNVVVALYQRAIGYSHPEDKVFFHEGESVVVETTKHYPPDTGACMAFLKNRERDLWREKPEPSADDEEALPIKVTIVREDASKSK